MSNTHTSSTGVSSTSATRTGRLLFIGVSAGNFLVLLDTSILNVALPAIKDDFHVSQALLPWASVAYTVVFAALLLAAGAVSDRLGPRRLYRTSLATFGVFSLACAAAPSMGALIASRVLLGVAAACMVPSSVALLAGLYPDPKRRAKAIGTWAAITSSGLLAGPMLGGLLVWAGSWRWIFVINLPVLAVALLVAARMTNPIPASARPVDLPGIALSTILLAGLTFGFIDGGNNGWARVLPVSAVGVALVALALLALVERRVAHPVLPPALFATRQVSADVLAAAIATLVFYGMLFTLTLWYQQDRGWSALATGLAFVPMTLPMCVLPIYTGRLVAAFGARRLIVFGLTCDVVAGVMLALVASAGRSWLVWVILAEVALVLASTTAIPAATADVAVVAPIEYAGSAQGALNAGRQAGSALGVAVLGPLLPAMGTIGIVLAAIAAVTVTGVLFGLRHPATRPAAQTI